MLVRAQVPIKAGEEVTISYMEAGTNEFASLVILCVQEVVTHIM